MYTRGIGLGVLPTHLWDKHLVVGGADGLLTICMLWQAQHMWSTVTAPLAQYYYLWYSAQLYRRPSGIRLHYLLKGNHQKP